MWKRYNPNPAGRNGIDCVYRAISKATGQDWYTTYWELAGMGAEIGDAPVANDVWGAYLRRKGFHRYVIPDSCPDCYTVKDFCEDNPTGLFVLATGSRVVTVINGIYFDSFDSGNEVPIYLWRKPNGL